MPSRGHGESRHRRDDRKDDRRDDRRDDRKNDGEGRSRRRKRDEDSEEDEKDRKKDRKSKRENGHEGKKRRPSPSEEKPAPKAAAPKDWREEVQQDEDERDLSTDDEERERKLEEARKRRQAMMKEQSARRAADPSAAEEEAAKKAAAESEPPKAVAAPAVSSKPVEEEPQGNMFDMLADTDALTKPTSKAVTIAFTGASAEDWDDEEGYYRPSLGEVIDERYHVTEIGCGKGVYAGVVKAKDQKGEYAGVVAIKILRKNDLMTKAAGKEVEHLQKLKAQDPGNSSYIIRLHDSFAYRSHFCMVFECMWDNVRSALKKLTKGKGFNLQAVRAYTKQLLVGLRHMRQCQIVHADIKPDNILMSEAHDYVKFCDLGTAVEISGCTISPYLGSGAYRPPEICLGCEWGYPIDMWALGCTVCEMFTGKVMMSSGSNNEHLRLIMEYKGKIPGKVIRKGRKWKDHFTDNLDFKYLDKENVERIITNLTAKRSIKDTVMERVAPEKRTSSAPEDQHYVRKVGMFADLLEQMLALDADKRITPEDALKHPFCAESWSGRSGKPSK